MNSAFNSLLQDFVAELQTSFPEERQLALFSGTLPSISTMQPNLPAEMFLSTFGPHAALIAARDAALFDLPDLDMGGLDMRKLWSDPRLSRDSRAAIWQYLHALLSLSSSFI
jgi:hypothetical protein